MRRSSFSKQWLWQLRHSVSRVELAQILLILVLVANYGYVVGFAAGVVISCAILKAHGGKCGCIA